MQLMPYLYPSIHLAKILLFVSLVKEMLQSKVYAAKEVGYSYSLSPSPNGLTLSFSGLSDPAIFRKFIGTVAGGECLSFMFLCEHDYNMSPSLASPLMNTHLLLQPSLTELPYEGVITFTTWQMML